MQQARLIGNASLSRRRRSQSPTDELRYRLSFHRAVQEVAEWQYRGIGDSNERRDVSGRCAGFCGSREWDVKEWSGGVSRRTRRRVCHVI
jgi:hypothetical protein